MKHLFIRLAPLLGILWSAFVFLQLSSYRSNVPFSDQWNFLFTPSPFTDMSLHDLFFRLHGPHYQGLSFIIDRIFYQLNDWNVARASRLITLELVLIGWLAVFLDKKQLKEKSWLIWFSMPLVSALAFYETIVTTPNASHSIFATLLFFVLLLTIDCWNSILQHVFFLCVSFLLIFSGFGLQWLLIYPFFLLCIVARQLFGPRILMYNEKFFWLLSWGVWAGTAYLFFDNYHPDTAAGEIPPLFDRWSELLRYSCLMFSGFIQIIAVKSMWVGLILMLSCLVCSLLSIFRWIRGKPRRYLVIGIMCAWSLSFSISCALGRAHLGLEFAQSSRYLIFFAPAFLSFLWITRDFLNEPFHIILAVLLAINAACLTPQHRATVTGFKTVKDNFIAAVLSGKTPDEAAASSGYPALGMDAEKIEYLRSRKLSFFAP